MTLQRSVIVVEPDPYLAVTVEALLSSVSPAPELVAVADLEELEDWMRPTGVVVAGPSCATRQAIEELAEIRERYPAMRLVLAFDRRPGAAMRDVVRSAPDALVDPNDAEDLREALHRSLYLADQLTAAIHLAESDAAAPLGQVFTVCSATGGCGKTFFSTNIALALGRYTGRKVVIIDLDLQFGEVMTALRLRTQHTVTDAIAIQDDAELAAYLPEMLVQHESGVWVLPAPLDPAEADSVETQDILRLVNVLQEHFDYIVVDTPTGLGELALAALDRSSHLFVLAALDLASIRNLRLFVQTLDRLHIARNDISLVLNKEETGIGIDVADVERLLPAGFRTRIPFSREVPRSMNNGAPVVTAQPGSVVSRRVVDGISDLLPADARAAIDDERARLAPDPWYRRLFGRSSRDRTTQGQTATQTTIHPVSDTTA